MSRPKATRGVRESTPVNYVYDCDHRHDLPFAEVRRLVGGKAANLTVMAVDLGLPVPPAFTITTTACNAYLADGWPDGLDAELREHMARMEERVGHAASETPPTHSWSASGRGRRSPCRG